MDERGDPVIFDLKFWQRRHDDDDDQVVSEDGEDPRPFEFKETGLLRHADGDRSNRDAPFWDAETTATVEADNEETAWRLVNRYVSVVERISGSVKV